MKILHVDLGSDIDTLELYPLSDVHIEDKSHNSKALLKWREEVLASKNRYVILNGDLINNATRDSVSDVYGATMSPNEAINFLVEFLKPIKDRILSVVTGNHENRTSKSSGVDIMERVCRELGLEDKYSPTAINLFISFGKSQGRACRKQIYSVFHRHGSGGGRKVGAKANQLEDMMNIVDSDLFLMSHTHQALTFKKSFYRVDYRNRKLTPVEKVFVNTNAWLGYEGYSVSHGYHPPSLKYPVVYLKGEEKEIEVKL